MRVGVALKAVSSCSGDDVGERVGEARGDGVASTFTDAPAARDVAVGNGVRVGVGICVGVCVGVLPGSGVLVMVGVGV